MCLSIEAPNTINFPFVLNGKLMVLDGSVFKHIKGLMMSYKMFLIPSKSHHNWNSVGWTEKSIALLLHKFSFHFEAMTCKKNCAYYTCICE